LLSLLDLARLEGEVTTIADLLRPEVNVLRVREDDP
jgi:hypothetical protein